VEFDVKLTRDGVPVIMHDDTLDRTTNGTGKVADMDWADIQKLDAGSWFDARFRDERVPHLADALRTILEGGMRPMIEIKPSPGRARATSMIALLEAAKIWPHNHPSPLVLSFNREALAAAAQIQPHWPRGLSFDEWQEDWRDGVKEVEAEAIVINADLLTSDHMPILTQSELTILTYTVDDPSLTKRLLSEGVSAVFCDNPGAMIAALK
jgi:glycerophosphoryl diester phosphodiesterase